MSGSTALREEFLQNLRLHLIDLSRRLEQDPSDDVADYVLYHVLKYETIFYSTSEKKNGHYSSVYFKSEKKQGYNFNNINTFPETASTGQSWKTLLTRLEIALSSQFLQKH